MSCAAVQEPPEWMGELRSLQALHLSFDTMQQLPQSLWNLTGLIELKIAGALEEVSPKIGQLSALQCLWSPPVVQGRG